MTFKLLHPPSPEAQLISVDENRYYAAVTGHRLDKLGGYSFHTPIRDSLRIQLKQVLTDLRAECAAMDRKPELWLITGCALGFDQDAAGVAYRLGIPISGNVSSSPSFLETFGRNFCPSYMEETFEILEEPAIILSKNDPNLIQKFLNVITDLAMWLIPPTLTQL